MNPWLIIGILVLLATSNAGSFFYGQHVEEAEQAQDQLDTERLAAARLKAKRQQVEALALDLATARAARLTRDRIITQEVTHYVDVTPASDRCTLPGTWRVRHDLAATGGDPVAAGGLAGAPEPVTDAAALDTVAGNYLACRAAIDQVKGWQAWWGRAAP